MPDAPHIFRGGSIVGREHARRRVNNQDAFEIVEGDGVTVGAVADGCGSCGHTEVGSRLGCVRAARFVRGFLRDHPDADAASVASATFHDLFDALETLTGWMGGRADEREDLVVHHLLFTLHVIVATPERVFAFGMGDGVVWCGDDVQILQNSRRNAPAYPAYRVIAGRVPADLIVSPIVHYEFDVSEVSFAGVGTDGAVEILRRQDETLRGGEHVDDLSQFGAAKYAQNATLLGKRLAVVGDVNGKLEDDTTLVVAVRPPEPETE